MRKLAIAFSIMMVAAVAQEASDILNRAEEITRSTENISKTVGDISDVASDVTSDMALDNLQRPDGSDVKSALRGAIKSGVTGPLSSDANTLKL